MYVVEMLHLLVVPSCFIADKFCCFFFLQKFVRIEQNDIKNYTDYLMKNIYKKPKKAHSGTDAAQTKWLFSKQHIFELGRWDEHNGEGEAPTQITMRGFVHSAETWDEKRPSTVRIWRQSPKITVDNIATHRVKNNAAFLDPITNLPLRKYHELFVISVLKKWDLWKNAQDCGYGAALASVYPPLTEVERAERTKLIEQNKKKRASSDYIDEADED